MNTNLKYQEILLMTNSRFSSRRWLKVTETEMDKNLSKKEQLMEACWNGLAPELLPECFEDLNAPSPILWEVNEAIAFIALEFGGFMEIKANEYSVNPYVFLPVQGYN